MTSDSGEHRDPAAPRAQRLTGAAPGAIGIVALSGPGADRVATAVLDGSLSTDATPRWATFRDADGIIDDGVVVRAAPDHILLMPHGGPRVMNRLGHALTAHGARFESDAAVAFPEAQSEIEALMLAVLSRAASPLAIDLLLDQPRRHAAHAAAPTPEDLARSARLNRLLVPPVIVLAGAPNIGKSTLTNTLTGRARSIVLDAAGTTRDATSGTIDLGGVVVEWLDTPGIRATDDPIEAASIARAYDLISHATLLVSAAAPDVDFVDVGTPPAVRLTLQADRGSVNGADLSVSAVTGAGIAELVSHLRDLLVPTADLDHPGPWWFAGLTPAGT